MWRLIAALTAALAAALVAGSATAAEIEDATGRRTVPDRIDRVMAAGPPASVVLYVLAPEKMIGWTAAPRPNEKPLLVPAVRDLPELGRLTGRGDTANVEVVINAKPDLILDFGTVNPTYVSLAKRVEEQTGVPYLLFDGRLINTARSIRQVGAALGVSERAERIARYVEETERAVDAALADVPPAARRRVYLARGADGLQTGLTGSINTEIIERAGGVNVAERGSGRAGLATVSLEQVLAWAPDTIITGDAGFAANPAWAPVPAVAAKRVVVAPRLPFGWIDEPPSVNRTLGLRWMAGVLYPDQFHGDIRATAKEFFRLFYQTDPDDATLDRVLAGEQPGRGH